MALSITCWRTPRTAGSPTVATYGMFRPEEEWVIELTRYTAVDGSAVLLARWHEKDSGNEGSTMFELKPQEESSRYGGLHGTNQQEARPPFQ